MPERIPTFFLLRTERSHPQDIPARLNFCEHQCVQDLMFRI